MFTDMWIPDDAGILSSMTSVRSLPRAPVNVMQQDGSYQVSPLGYLANVVVPCGGSIAKFC
jgi:hypothetical protein